jgi:hypothetical protein
LGTIAALAMPVSTIMNRQMNRYRDSLVERVLTVIPTVTVADR